MSITAVLELEFRPGTLSIAHTMLSRVLTETRAFDGCLSVEVFEDPGNDHRWVLFERWESVQHDSAYRAYRAGPGTVTQLGDILASAPALTIYAEPVDL